MQECLVSCSGSPKKTLTGFSEQTSFQKLAEISQNNEVVGTVKLWKGNELQSYHEPLYLRGITHDYYTGVDKYQWTHAPLEDESRQEMSPAADDGGTGVWVPQELASSQLAGRQIRSPRYRQEIELYPTGTSVLFAMPGVVSIKPQDVGSMRRFSFVYMPHDQTIRANDSIREPIRYEVTSTGVLGDQPLQSRIRSRIDPKIGEFARLPEVTGGLAARRDAEVAARADHGLFYDSPLDQEIASRIETYLRKNYKYTLNLTQVEIIKNRDPMVAFLYDFKKGHCEYFAGAMTLLCQSLGMDARYVAGFKVDDYNDFGHFYTVRQSHAHAWVEVRNVGSRCRWKAGFELENLRSHQR